MTVKLLGLSICALSISGCFHDGEQNRLNHTVSGTVNGERTILGKVMRVYAQYDNVEGAAGDDEVFLTGDDALVRYDALEEAANGVQRSIRFISPGQDGTWFTDDDILAEYSKSETGADGTNTSCSFVAAGNDGKWFTGDDGRSGCYVTTSAPVDGGGKQEKTVIHDSAGPDGIWSSSDDSVLNYHVARFDGDGELTDWIGWFLAGDDGIMNTADDQIGQHSRWRTLSYDSSTNTRTRVGTHTMDANSEALVQSDMTIVQNTYVTLSGFGRMLSYPLDSSFKSYASPGPDGEWLTPDDTLSRKSSTEILEKSETVSRSRSIEWAPGPNGILGDADDSVTYYRVHRLEIDGKGTNFTSDSFAAAGPDGEWFTDDDELVHKYLSIGFLQGSLPSE